MSQHLMAELTISAAQVSDAGVKEVNEDCMGIRVPEGELLTHKGAVAMVADGVSTAEAGKEASETCVQSFLNDYFSTPDSWTVPTAAQKVLTALNRWLYGQGQHYIEAHKGYISTLSILVLKSNTAHVFHVGDSRVYLLRGGELEQLTNDHCARIAGQQAYLTRAMGMDVHLEVDYRKLEVQQGDIFFLSTDGVHDFVSQRQLLEQLESGDEFEQSCEKLIALARENGSEDNLTCQILRIEQLPEVKADEVYQHLGALPFPPALEPGMKLDGYVVEELIHASTRSQLYRVRDEDSGQICAMKTPSVNYQDDPAYIERFIMEQWVGQRISSPHVVKVVTPQRKPRWLYYLTEYVEGETLDRWIENHPDPSIHQVVQLVEQVVKGLRAFHRKEVLHQDLKPDNIVVDKEGGVKIIDFGSTYVAGVHEISVPIERDRILGTADYSAPELLLQEKASQRSDQFSLACIVYEMLTGKAPYGDALARIKRPADLARLGYTPSYHHNPMVPVWLDGALRRALKPHATHRYDALSEFVFDLEHPNPQFLQDRRLPLIERNPVRLWQGLSLLLFLTQVLTLVLLMRT